MNGRKKGLALALFVSLVLVYSLGADGGSPAGVKVRQKIYVAVPIKSDSMESDELRAFNDMLKKAIGDSDDFEVVSDRMEADWLFGQGRIERHDKRAYTKPLNSRPVLINGKPITKE